MISSEARDELEIIRRNNGGFLKAEKVVDHARKRNSALHRYFEWDDGIAAERWRLRQAQELIRVVVVVNEETSEKVRAFVSLSHDRNSGRGYRSTVEVFEDEELFNILLADAKSELEMFARKYAKLREIAELRGLFKEVDKIIWGKPEKMAVV